MGSTPTGFTETPPISDPTCTINGRTYVVVYNLMAEFKCSEWGQDPRQMMVVLDPKSEDPRRVFYLFQLFAACVAHNFKPGEIAPTAQQWVEQLGQDAELVGLLFQAVVQALGKRLLEAAKKQQKTAPQPALETPVLLTSAPN